HQRIDEGLHRAIAQTENEASPVKQIKGHISVALSGDEISADSHDDPGGMAEKCEVHRGLVADSVDKQAETDDAHGKWPDTNSCQSALLGGIKIELLAPLR